MNPETFTATELATIDIGKWAEPDTYLRVVATVAALETELARLKASVPDVDETARSVREVAISRMGADANEEARVPDDVTALAKEIRSTYYRSPWILSWADTLEAQARRIADLEKWVDDDATDEWTPAIHAAHPVRSGSHDTYGVAMRMVSTRRSKGALVALVNWLLVRLAAREAHDVRVEVVGDVTARLFVNGYGVASWPANAEVPHTSASGLDYAHECARVLREALAKGPVKT